MAFIVFGGGLRRDLVNDFTQRALVPIFEY